MIHKETVLQELTFKASRSSGAGGQHVNKVSSKIELYFNVNTSKALTNLQKRRLQNKLKKRITNNGVLILQCDSTRSQHKNKEFVIKRFFELLKASLAIQKKRIQTKIPQTVIKKRILNKRYVSEKKANRKTPKID